MYVSKYISIYMYIYVFIYLCIHTTIHKYANAHIIATQTRAPPYKNGRLGNYQNC